MDHPIQKTPHKVLGLCLAYSEEPAVLARLPTVDSELGLRDNHLGHLLVETREPCVGCHVWSGANQSTEHSSAEGGREKERDAKSKRHRAGPGEAASERRQEW